MSLTLYELSDNYQKLLDMVDDIDPQAFDDTLEMLQDDINHKAENIGKLIKSLEAESKAIRDEEKRLADRRRARENKVQRLKQYLQEHMEQTGIDRVDGDVLSVRLQNNPASVHVIEDSLIPEEFWIEQTPRIDKKQIAQALKDGKMIAGATLVQKQSLRIG